jgi:hypothetical protein
MASIFAPATERITSREAREADLLECLAIEPGHLGDRIVGRDRAIEIWKEMLRRRSFHSCVIESAHHPGRILGFAPASLWRRILRRGRLTL